MHEAIGHTSRVTLPSKHVPTDVRRLGLPHSSCLMLDARCAKREARRKKDALFILHRASRKDRAYVACHAP